MELPEHLKYTSEHEWVALDGTRARVGITDYAQDTLGDVVYVSLPEVGTVVAAAGACAEVESTKAVSDIYAPVAGTITEANEALTERPELLNQDPYGAGWIFSIDVNDTSDLDDLLDAAAYRSLVEAA